MRKGIFPACIVVEAITYPANAFQAARCAAATYCVRVERRAAGTSRIDRRLAARRWRPASCPPSCGCDGDGEEVRRAEGAGVVNRGVGTSGREPGDLAAVTDDLACVVAAAGVRR
jgi:hypothetical protein